MLRELSIVLQELHDGMLPMARGAAAGVRLSRVEMTIPMDIQPVLRGGGCAVLADVSRSHADAAWRDAPSRLHVLWVAQGDAVAHGDTDTVASPEGGTP